jgi:hypothetical protein
VRVRSLLVVTVEIYDSEIHASRNGHSERLSSANAKLESATNIGPTRNGKLFPGGTNKNTIVFPQSRAREIPAYSRQKWMFVGQAPFRGCGLWYFFQYASQKTALRVQLSKSS